MSSPVLTVRWFLYPPSDAVYSKQHPLLWYRSEYSTLATEVSPMIVSELNDNGY